MDLLLIRHAPSEDRDKFAQTGQPDHLRPLTESGVKRMQLAARGLTTLALPIERLVTSPAVRARQTADLVQDALEVKAIEEQPPLAPLVDVEDIVDWLCQQPLVDGLAVVGHEPQIGQVAEILLCGRPLGNMPMKKGGMILLRFDHRISRGNARLVWALPPAVLRALAD